MCRICVFAGTTEGRRLIERLCGRGARLAACVATEYGEVLLGSHEDVEILAGRMDEAQMCEMLAGERFDLVVDATHPYAAVVTENLRAACRTTATEYLRLLRPSCSEDGDGVFVRDTAECVEYLKQTTGNILLTTGSKELPAFCADDALRGRLYARVLPMAASLKICEECGIAPDHILAMQGPFSEELNVAMLRAVGASVMVTKDTGGAGGYGAKISAAQKAGAQTVIIGRPIQREGVDLEGAVQIIEDRFQLTPPRKRVSLVGVGMGGMETRTMGMERAVREAECLIGAKRMLECVDCVGRQTFAAVAAKDVARIIRESCYQRFAVLLSGDVGFYSGAKSLTAELTDVDLEVLPGIGSLQYFCARLRRPWEDVRAISLHGRDCDLVREVERHSAVFVLVGGENGAADALGRLRDAGMGRLTAHVGERLGYPEERITDGMVDSLADEHWDPLSVLLIENGSDRVVTHGLPDEAFERDETPMTKSEVRSVALSKLQLTERAIVYDIGSGSGSVSVEAALQSWRGRVYAVEMKEKAIALTRRNAKKFRLSNLEVVCGKAPEALSELPAPTHAFIGGSTGNLDGIIQCLLEKNPGVRIVATAVTLETLAELTEAAKAFGFCDIAEISVAKPRALGRYHLMTAQNPVYVFTMQNGGGENG